MSDETRHWRRQFFWLFLLAALVFFLQAAAGVFLAVAAMSPVLLTYGLDSAVGGLREGALAARLGREGARDPEGLAEGPAFRILGALYLGAGLVAVVGGLAGLWRGGVPTGTLAGVILASASVLLIPIVGSYMKAVAVELRSPDLRSAAVFTFGNSYLSMVLLVSLLVRLGMDRWWGDAVGAIVMGPFVLQKGLQMLAGPTPAAASED